MEGLVGIAIVGVTVAIIVWSHQTDYSPFKACRYKAQSLRIRVHSAYPNRALEDTPCID